MALHPNNNKNINLIKSIVIEKEYENFVDIIYESLLEQKESLPITLDIARVAADKFSTKIIDASYKYYSADIRAFDKIDYVFDLCDRSTIPEELLGKFNNVIALAILEHVWQPFEASKNLVSLLDKNKPSKLWLFAPFLYPYHAPENLEYQDYFRFTKHSWAVLFPDAKKITISPVRGRVTTALLVGFKKYKAIEKLPFAKKIINFTNKMYSRNENQTQVSGYNVMIDY